ncbi:tubulin binding cofactor A [Peniophora sp. CONT]|nr:tubulin binding cofactor A [Peniophora sp. CONT]
MSEVEKTRKQLRIKTGVAKRLMKEVGMYRKEVEQNQIRLEKLRADGAEDWDVKNAGLLVAESEKMVTDSSDRMGRAVGELRDLVVLAKKHPELSNDEEYLKAEEALEEAAL